MKYFIIMIYKQLKNDLVLHENIDTVHDIYHISMWIPQSPHN